MIDRPTRRSTSAASALAGTLDKANERFIKNKAAAKSTGDPMAVDTPNTTRAAKCAKLTHHSNALEPNFALVHPATMSATSAPSAPNSNRMARPLEETCKRSRIVGILDRKVVKSTPSNANNTINERCAECTRAGVGFVVGAWPKVGTMVSCPRGWVADCAWPHPVVETFRIEVTMVLLR